MKILPTRVKVWQELFDNMPVRQRMLISLVVLSVIFFSWDNWIHQPQSAALDKSNHALSQTLNNIKSIVAQKEKLARQIGNDNSDEQIAYFREQIQQINQQIDLASQELIDPEQMSLVLQELLAEHNQLKITGMSTAEPQAINISGRSSNSSSAGAAVIYKHQLNLRFEADYLTTLNYIHSIEQMGWRIFWDSVEINSSEYPRTEVMISLYTLSLNEGWIGV